MASLLRFVDSNLLHLGQEEGGKEGPRCTFPSFRPLLPHLQQTAERQEPFLATACRAPNISRPHTMPWVSASSSESSKSSEWTPCLQFVSRCDVSELEGLRGH